MSSSPFPKDQVQANLLALLLIDKSKWFEVTPLPDDEYEFVCEKGIWNSEPICMAQ